MTWLGLAYPRAWGSLSDLAHHWRSTWLCQEEHMETLGGAPLCFAPPSLLSSEEEPMDTGTIHLTPHPKNENRDGEKGIALLW